MPPVLRRAGPADIPALHALIESAYRGDSARDGWTHEADLLEGERTSPEELAVMFASPDQRILVAERHGVLVGSVAITRKSPGLAYLGMLAVSPRLQAAGVGRRLITGAEDVAVRAFGADAMEMTVIARRSELIAWYERRGYRLTGERRPFPYPAPGAEHLGMVVLERHLR